MNDMEESRNKAQKYYQDADFRESKRNAKQWLSFAKDKGDKKEEVAAWCTVANSYYWLENYKKSIENGSCALKIATEVGDEELEAQARSILSSSYYGDNNYKQSIEHCNQILRIPEGNKQRKWDVQAYGNLAQSSFMLQNGVKDPDYKESIKNGELQLEAAKRLSDREGEIAAYSILFQSYTKSGDKKKADEYQQLKQRALQDQSQSKAAAAGGSPNYSSVPSEVESRGPGANIASENDLNNRKVKLYRARIILIGQDQAGKTSLKKSLFSLPFESKEESTEGIKGDPTVFEVEVKQVKNWLLSDDARITAEEVQEEEPKEIKMNAGPTREDKTESVTPELKIDPAIPPEELTDVLVQHLRGLNLQSDATSVENHTTLDVWDFVGQHLYYAIYPVFLSPKAIYMLICNLSKDLKATVPPCARKTVFESNVQNENSETNLDNLLSWLTSVSTLCPTKTDATKKLDYLCPPIFIVGTHADKPHEDIKKMEEQIQKEIFDNKFGDHVVGPVFSVDNTQGSSGEGLAELRKRMNEVLMEQPYMGEEVPLRWLGFEKVVQAMVAVKVYYLKLEQLQTIIQKVCSIEDENEVATMLDFYHDLGVIVKHRNTVVLQAQWLIGIFKQLIALPSFKEMKSKHRQLWKTLQDEGVLSMELVNHVFSKFCTIKEDILDMMEQFGLIVKFSTSPTDENYFVPCQLEKPPAQVLAMEPSPSDPFPLYLRFELGFVPHGFFSQLVSEFTRLCSESGLIERSTASSKFYDGVSKFIVKKTLRHHLVMLCENKFIKIVLKQAKPEPSAELEEVANTVRQSLEDAMEPLTSKLPWLKNLKPPDWCAACPHCSCLLKILPKEGHLDDCKTCHNVEPLTLPGLKKWFSMKSTGPTTTKASLPAATPTIPTSQPQRPAIGPTTTKASLPAATATIPTFQRPGTAPVTKAELSTRTQKPAVRPGYHPGTGKVYNMTANPRGFAVIVNNKEFKSDPAAICGNPKTRHGSEKDAQQVKELFTDLGFKVKLKENLKKEDLLNVVYDFANKAESAHDCFVLWLMSHGLSGSRLICAEGKTVSIQSIQEQVMKTGKLNGKPKLFFIQACRGNEEHAIPPQEQKSTVRHTTSTTETDSHGLADSLFSYATVDDCVAYRNSIAGSYFVTALVEVFRQNVAVDDLVSMLTKVNNKVNSIEVPGNEKSGKCFKQMPELRHTLKKTLYF